MKLTFKSGLVIGIALGFVVLTAGYLFLGRVKELSSQIATLDVVNLEYRNLENEEVSLKDITQNKNVFVNYWATWCRPCIEEFPLLNEVANASQESFVFVMVSDQDIKKIKNFNSDKDYNFIYLQTDNFLTQGINPIPQSFILDSKLQVKKHHPGPVKGTANQVIDSLKTWVKSM